MLARSAIVTETCGFSLKRLQALAGGAVRRFRSGLQATGRTAHTVALCKMRAECLGPPRRMMCMKSITRAHTPAGFHDAAAARQLTAGRIIDASNNLSSNEFSACCGSDCLTGHLPPVAFASAASDESGIRLGAPIAHAMVRTGNGGAMIEGDAVQCAHFSHDVYLPVLSAPY